MICTSITGQVGHVAFGRQTAQGSANTTSGAAAGLAPFKITGDSLVANTNPLIAEGEIGMGRDVSDAVPGGFQSAGAVNGNLRARAAAILLEACLGTKALGGNFAGTSGVNNDKFSPADALSWWSIEKQIGSATPQQLVLLYTDAMVNTLSISAPAGALATFSAGCITAGEARIERGSTGQGYSGATGPIVNTEAAGAYPAAYDDLLVFHGGRIMSADSPTGQVSPQSAVEDDTFQSVEVALNNNLAADEYTVRPSRFLRSITPGIRQVDVNFTLVFENPDKYSKYAYGNQLRNTPSYSFYLGALQLFLGNFQLLNATGGQGTATVLDGPGSTFPYSGASNATTFIAATPGVNVGYLGSTPAAPGNGAQYCQVNIPKLAFTGFPVALASGRIAVTTSARALKDPNADIVTAWVGPGGAGLQY